MARTARKVESLADEEGMNEAMKVVLDRAEQQGIVEWSDVRNDLTSGQWGRLIQTGILIDANDGDGFVVDDPEAVRAAVGDGSGSVSATTSPTETASTDESDDEGWTKYDKAATVGAVAMFAGYWSQSVRSAMGRMLDVALGPLDAALPFYVVVLVLAMFTGLYSTLLQANLMDMDVVGEHQDRMQDIQDRRKEAKERGDDEALERIQKEQMDAMGNQLGMFKAQFRPMIWIMLLTVPVFLWMYWMIGARGGVSHLVAAEKQLILPLIGEVSWRTGVVGPIQTWIVWYFLCSMGFTQIIRKSLNIQTAPT